MVENPPAKTGNIRDSGSIPGSGRSPGERHGNPLQYSCLENRMDRGAWQATVHVNYIKVKILILRWKMIIMHVAFFWGMGMQIKSFPVASKNKESVCNR